MARPVDPNAQYRVKPHSYGGNTYASTQPPSIDPETGKKKYRYVHWGKIDEKLKFFPGKQFFLASPEQRARLIFPEGWDLSEAEKLVALYEPEGPVYDADCQNRLYGDIWLLEQVAVKTGVRQDLERVFDGNRGRVDDILTLAMFHYLTAFTSNRVARWQQTVKTPSFRELTPSVVTRLIQCITEQHRLALLKLRAARLGKDALCSADSISRTVYGESLADIRWGVNKEQLAPEQTREVVVYTLSSHMPVYYRTFPGNLPDSQSLDVILADLEHAGFKSLVLITDSGYETLCNLEKYILRGQAMVMCVKTGQKEVVKAIRELGAFGAYPAGMMFDPDAQIFHKQYNIDYEIESIGQASKLSDRLKLNLYLDPMRRSHELLELKNVLLYQETALNELLEDKAILWDDAVIRRDYSYYKVSSHPATRVIKSFKLDEKKVSKARTFAGFFAIKTHGVDFGAMDAHRACTLRDEQEQDFQQMQELMVLERQRNWSEGGKTGRLFIFFVSLILRSYVRHVWKGTKLFDLFSSPLDIVDEMRSIRLIEHPNGTKVMTPFVGAQVSICEAFGFDIPEGCAPTCTPHQNLTRKRGRPPKTTVEKY